MIFFTIFMKSKLQFVEMMMMPFQKKKKNGFVWKDIGKYSECLHKIRISFSFQHVGNETQRNRSGKVYQVVQVDECSKFQLLDALTSEWCVANEIVIRLGLIPTLGIYILSFKETSFALYDCMFLMLL